MTVQNALRRGETEAGGHTVIAAPQSDVEQTLELLGVDATTTVGEIERSYAPKSATSPPRMSAAP